MFERFITHQKATDVGVPRQSPGARPAIDDTELRQRFLGDELLEKESTEANEASLPSTTSTSGALSDTWSALKQIVPGRKSDLAKLGRSCDTPVAPEFDILRTQVLQVLRAEGWHRIGVVAPTKRCGTTFTAMSLACGLARIEGLRTLLVDLNQRTPGLHKALDVPWSGNVSDFLSGEIHASQYVRKYSETLGLVLNSAVSPNAADILHGGCAAEVLEDTMLTLDPSVVLYDLPPMLAYDDLAAFAPNLDAVIMVADGAQTSPSDILACEKMLAGHVPLLGVVLNRATRT